MCHFWAHPQTEFLIDICPLLHLNFSDIRALVQQQQEIILAYDNYYKASTKALEDAELQRQAQEEAAAVESAKDGIDLNPFN